MHTKNAGILNSLCSISNISYLFYGVPNKHYSAKYTRHLNKVIIIIVIVIVITANFHTN